MAEKKKLKVYKLTISPALDDVTGVSVISIVKDPAIEKDFLKFAKDGDVAHFKFAVTNKAKRIVSGPIMVPDFPIYRNERDAKGVITDEWYVLATKEVIAAAIQKFFKLQRTTNTSLEHDGALLNGVYLIESFQVDKDRGITAPTGYGALPDGTWFGSMKVDNQDVWNEIESGNFKGFSIEGLFTYEKTDATILKQRITKSIELSDLEAICLISQNFN